jgi:hypothetical protein
MQFYKFNSPNDWNGYVNIDKEIDIEEINMAEGIFNDEDENRIGENTKETHEDGNKSKSSQHKSKKGKN